MVRHFFGRVSIVANWIFVKTFISNVKKCLEQILMANS